METMLDIIALGNNMHVTFFTIEKLGGGSETHVFIDVYGMIIRICLSSPFFAPLWRPKREDQYSSLLEIDLLQTVYFSAE